MRGVKVRSADSLLDWSTALKDLQVPGSLHVFIDEGNSYEFLKTMSLFIDLYSFYGIMYT